MSLPISKLEYMDDIIKNNYLVVPNYQRGIAWEIPENLDFIDDILDVYEGKEAKHFLGQIVTYQEDDQTKMIVDGQQRLAASLLFYAAVKSIATTLMDRYQRANQLTSHLRDSLRDIIRDVNTIIKVNEDYGETDEQVSLTLQSTTSNDYFLKILHNRQPKVRPRDKRPVKNLSEAYLCFKNSLLATLSNDDYNNITGKIRFLRDVLNAFSRQFYLSIIIVNDKQEAFTIFETLNNRGRNLATSDLVKTHLLSLADNDDENQDFHHKWRIVSTLFNDDTNALGSFLKEYWLARSGRERINDLYNSISQSVQDSLSATNFLNDLLKLKDTYYMMLNPTQKHSQGLTDNHDLLSYFNDLKQLGFKAYYSIPLAMHYHDFSDSDVLIVSHHILSLLTRYSSIVGYSARKMGPNFVKVARHVWTGRLTSVQSIVDYLNQFNIDDNKVINSFRSWNRNYASQKAMKYLLFNLEQYDEDEFVPDNFDFSDYNLLPLNITNKYRLDDKDDDGNYYHDYLGNYTLIEKQVYKEHQRAIDRGLSIDEMVSILRGTNLKHNYDLATGLKGRTGPWNVDQIKHRQDNLQVLVTMIWQ